MYRITDDYDMTTAEIETRLSVNNRDEFDRVYEFVKPVEEETLCDETSRQMYDFIGNLPEDERCSWMCRHCKSLATIFEAHPERLEFVWSGVDNRTYADMIAKGVSKQFSDITFRINDCCIDTNEWRFGTVEK